MLSNLVEQPLIISILALLGFITFFIIRNYKNIFDISKYHTSKKVEYLKNILKNNQLSIEEKDFLQNELLNDEFYLATKIYADKKSRAKILQIISNSKIFFKMFVNAKEYITYQDGNITVRIHLFDKIVPYFFGLLSFIFFIMPVLFVIFTQDLSSLNILFSIVIFGVAGIVLLTYFLVLKIKISQAKKIKNYLLNNN